MLAWLVEAVQAHAKLFRTLATDGLVLMEYHEGSRCEGVGDDTLVAYIGDNNISTARLVDGTWTFKSIACHLSAGANPALASTAASG